ncbi:unnamed protein product [Arabidopsis halleri]
MSASSSRESSSAAGDGSFKVEIKEYGGGKGPVRYFFDEDSCIARVDVPGCSGVSSVHPLEKTNVGFRTEEVDENNNPLRTYSGFVKFPTVYDPKNAEHKVDSGVLWVTVTRKQRRQG